MRCSRSLATTRNRLLTALATGALVLSVAAAAPATAADSSATKCADPSGTVKIGASYFGGVGKAYADIGGDDSLTPADQAVIDNYKAGVDALNASGGLAGCEVELVTFNFRATSPDYHQESQKECAAFTQDEKVVAVFGAAYETQAGFDCYAKAKTPFFTTGGKYAPTCADLKKYAGYIYLASSVASCRFSSFVGMWDKAGLFPKDAKVGILAIEDGSGQGTYVAEKVYGPALKKLGIPFQTFSYPAPINTPDFANTNAAMGPAILKFKNEGVNVVLFTPAGPTGPAAFMPQAANQSFFPAYGLDTADGLAISAALGANAVKQGVGISWAIADLPLAAQQTLPANPAITGCAAWSAPSQATLTGSSPYCDYLNLLKSGFANASKADAASLKKGIDALGTSFDSSITYGGATKFGKNVFGGASMAQMLEFDPTTKAWKLASAKQAAVTIP
ncbi:MAG: hypothetical protein ABW033_00955 [Acidimicrobiia bacterium]